jgi:hypothetical protein
MITGRSIGGSAGTSNEALAFGGILTPFALASCTEEFTAVSSTNSYSSFSQSGTTGVIILSQVSASLNFANDVAAAAAGVPIGGLYRNGNVVQIRIS